MVSFRVRSGLISVQLAPSSVDFSSFCEPAYTTFGWRGSTAVGDTQLNRYLTALAGAPSGFRGQGLTFRVCPVLTSMRVV